MHARQQIRKAIVALLAPASAGTWKIVRDSRIESQRQVGNYLMVYVDSEPVEKVTIHSASPYERFASVNITGMLRMPGNTDTENIEDKMDAMAAEIEAALTNDALHVLLPNVGSIALQSTDMVVTVDDEEKPQRAELHQVWQVSYSTMEGQPEVFI